MTVPATFIERHGLVAYTSHLGARYPRAGRCEVGLCQLAEAWRLSVGADRKARAEAQLARLAAEREQLLARHVRLLGWTPRTAATSQRRQRELRASRRQLADSAARLAAERDYGLAQAERMLVPDPPRRLIFEHCHDHGWVRGLACESCNGRVGAVEGGLGLQWLTDDAERAAMLAHLARCPDCDASAIIEGAQRRPDRRCDHIGRAVPSARPAT